MTALLIFRALWGMDTGTIEERVEQIAAAGYDGVEVWMPQENVPLSPDAFRALLEQNNLKLITAGAVREAAQIEPTLRTFAEYGPLKANLQSGRDSMTFDEGSAFFETALLAAEAVGLPVSHETHRGCILFTPWTTLAYLQRFPTLRLTADYSHWVNVCERLPDDQAEALALANRRVFHIHGRVGYEEGPQVPDPSAPEYAPHLAWHERQWAQIKAHHVEAGAELLTFTPEYGPPSYLHTLPHTNVPVADLWQVCLWGKERARAQLG